MIPIQYALRRRMMGSNTRKWTLEITSVTNAASVSINGNNLEAGIYKVDDGTIAHFEAKGLYSNIKVDDNIVAEGVSVVKYDLEIHSNYTAVGTNGGVTGKSGYWKITTQQ